MAESRRSQEERREATRRALLCAGRELFAERGYYEASQEEIASRAGLTRGALYHHFEGGKRGLFREVVVQMQEEIEAEILAVARERYERTGDAFEAYLASFEAYLEACLREDVKVVLMKDGASVLGWKEWYEIDAGYGLAQTEAGLGRLMELGVMERQPVRPLARLMYGASLEAAMYVVDAEEPESAKREVVRLTRKLLEGLLVREEQR